MTTLALPDFLKWYLFGSHRPNHQVTKPHTHACTHVRMHTRARARAYAHTHTHRYKTVRTALFERQTPADTNTSLPSPRANNAANASSPLANVANASPETNAVDKTEHAADTSHVRTPPSAVPQVLVSREVSPQRVSSAGTRTSPQLAHLPQVILHQSPIREPLAPNGQDGCLPKVASPQTLPQDVYTNVPTSLSSDDADGSAPPMEYLTMAKERADDGLPQRSSPPMPKQNRQSTSYGASIETPFRGERKSYDANNTYDSIPTYGSVPPATPGGWGVTEPLILAANAEGSTVGSTNVMLQLEDERRCV